MVSFAWDKSLYRKGDSMSFDYGLVNKEQKAAIDHLNGPCRVTAGAGSGKTSVLTKRIARLLDRGIEPKNILAITFTKKAATEMQERLIALVGKEQGSGVFLGTFHSFGLKLLFWQCHRLKTPKPEIVSGLEQKQVMEKACLTGGRGKDKITSDIDPDTALSFVSWQKNYLILPDDDELDFSCLEDSDKLDVSYKEDLRRVYRRYEKLKDKANQIDFDDMLVKAYLLLKKDRDMRGICQNKYKYILVDEFQDTNVAQYEMVKKLAGGAYQNVFIVGDARQAIYSWRASKVDFILNFDKDWRDSRTIELNDNYRSTVEIVDLSTKIISHSPIKYPGICRSGKGNHGLPPMYFCAKDDNEEAQMVAVITKYLVTVLHKCDFSDIAVLYRLNAESRPFEDAFAGLAIPYHVAGAEGFYGRRDIKELLAFLHLAVNPKDTESFHVVMNVPDRGITSDIFAGIKNVVLEKDIDIIKILQTIGQEESETTKPYLKLGNVLEAMHEMNDDKEKSVGDMLREAVYSLDYIPFLKKRAKGRKKHEDDDEVSMVIESFIKSCDKFANVDALDEHIKLVEEQQADRNKSKVQMMSLHRSKGLEFNTVFMVGMVNGILPHSKSIRLNEDGSIDMESIEEERRLTYVGATRAKECLMMSSYEAAGKDDAQKSIFLDEIYGELKDISPLAKQVREYMQAE